MRASTLLLILPLHQCANTPCTTPCTSACPPLPSTIHSLHSPLHSPYTYLGHPWHYPMPTLCPRLSLPALTLPRAAPSSAATSAPRPLAAPIPQLPATSSANGRASRLYASAVTRQNKPAGHPLASSVARQNRSTGNTGAVTGGDRAAQPMAALRNYLASRVAR